MPYRESTLTRARTELQEALCALAHEILAQPMNAGVRVDVVRTILSYEHEPRLGASELLDMAGYRPAYATATDLAACAVRGGYFRRAADLLSDYATATGITR